MQRRLAIIVWSVVATVGCGGSSGAPTSPSTATTVSTTTSTTTGTSTGTNTTATGTMAISYLAVDLASSPFISNISLNTWPATTYPAIHVFGRTYQGLVEPTLNFDLLKIGTPVFAPFDGTILQVVDQPASCDTEMYFNDGNGDQFNRLSYDHVKPLSKFTTKGASFTAGEQIATIGAWECTQNFGRVEMMVVTSTTAGGTPTSSRCPVALFDASRKSTLVGLITTVMDWWNSLSPLTPYTAQDKSTGICTTDVGPL